MFESEEELEYMLRQCEEYEREKQEFEKFMEELEEESVNFERAQRQRDLQKKEEDFRNLFADEF